MVTRFGQSNPIHQLGKRWSLETSKLQVTTKCDVTAFLPPRGWRGNVKSYLIVSQNLSLLPCRQTVNVQTQCTCSADSSVLTAGSIKYHCSFQTVISTKGQEHLLRDIFFPLLTLNFQTISNLRLVNWERERESWIPCWLVILCTFQLSPLGRPGPAKLWAGRDSHLIPTDFHPLKNRRNSLMPHVW